MALHSRCHRVWCSICLKNATLRLEPSFAQGCFEAEVGHRNGQWFTYGAALDMWTVSGVMIVQKQKGDRYLSYKWGMKAQRGSGSRCIAVSSGPGSKSLILWASSCGLAQGLCCPSSGKRTQVSCTTHAWDMPAILPESDGAFIWLCVVILSWHSSLSRASRLKGICSSRPAYFVAWQREHGCPVAGLIGGQHCLLGALGKPTDRNPTVRPGCTLDRSPVYSVILPSCLCARLQFLPLPSVFVVYNSLSLSS